MSKGFLQLEEILHGMAPTQRVVVIIANGDNTVLQGISNGALLKIQTCLDILDNPKIQHIFVENLDEHFLPHKVSSLPLGLNPKEGSTWLLFYTDFINLEISSKPLLFTEFNRYRENATDFIERGEVKQLVAAHWAQFVAEESIAGDSYLADGMKNNTATVPSAVSRAVQLVTVDETETASTNATAGAVVTTTVMGASSKVFHRERKRALYLRAVSRNMFALCVHGGGLDPNPKVPALKSLFIKLQDVA